jgi:hypothetical protein
MVESASAVDLYEELRGIAGALDSAGVSYALVGGLAVSIYATPRATEDVDILIAPDDAGRAVRALEGAGFRAPGAPFAVADGRLRIIRLLKFAGDDLLPLDLLAPVDPALAPLLSDRVVHDLGGRPVAVVGLRSLRVLKRLRRSAQDLADLEALGPEESSEGAP